MHKQNKRHRRVRKFKNGTNFPGQHFMHNKRLVKDLVNLAEIKPQELVIEIGAGTGALTLPLAEKAGKVLAVENDPILAQKLQSKIAERPNVKLIQKDFLQVNLPRSPFCVVANIPYSITTPILGKLLDQPAVPLQRAVFVVEKGAAKRFTTSPVTNPRILKWRMWFHMEMGRTISPRHFSPPPRVDSAVLTVWRKRNFAVSLHHHARFKALAAHSLKYPQLPVDEALKDVFTPPQMKRLAHNLKIDRNAPICSLTEIQWGVVFNTMIQYVKPYRWPK